MSSRSRLANCPPTTPPRGRRSPPCARSSRRPSATSIMFAGEAARPVRGATSTSSSTTSAGGSPGSASRLARAATSRRCASRPTTWWPVATSSGQTSAAAVPTRRPSRSPSGRSGSCSWPPTRSTPTAPARRGDAGHRRGPAQGGLPRPVRDQAAVGRPHRRPPGGAAPPQPDIVHFSGHGSETSEIVLEDQAGASRVVPQHALSRLFSVLPGKIRCVVLNACYSERAGAGHRRDHRLRGRDDQRGRRRRGDRLRDRLLPRPGLRPERPDGVRPRHEHDRTRGPAGRRHPAPRGQEDRRRPTCRATGPK